MKIILVLHIGEGHEDRRRLAHIDNFFFKNIKLKKKKKNNPQNKIVRKVNAGALQLQGCQ
jgi:hypothetical protein